MGDYISREKLAAHLADIQYGEAPTGRESEDISYQTGVYAGIDMAYVALMRFPAADVRPVVRGEWENETGYIFSELTERLYCPVCRSFSSFGPLTRRNFCPNCGADMREVAGEK